MAVDIALGTTLGVVVGAPSPYDGTTFAAQTHVVVGEIISIGDFGGSAQINTNIPLATGIVNKRAGSYDYGDLTLTITRDTADAGQTALKAGFDGAEKGNVHSFEIVRSDGTEQYFTGIISGFVTNIGDANSWLQATVTIAVNNSVVEVN